MVSVGVISSDESVHRLFPRWRLLERNVHRKPEALTSSVSSRLERVYAGRPAILILLYAFIHVIYVSANPFFKQIVSADLRYGVPIFYSFGSSLLIILVHRMEPFLPFSSPWWGRTRTPPQIRYLKLYKLSCSLLLVSVHCFWWWICQFVPFEELYCQ